jgi:hypothetical protein
MRARFAFFPSAGVGISRPPWKLTARATSAPLRAISSTTVPPKQEPMVFKLPQGQAALSLASWLVIFAVRDRVILSAP